ncbi:FCD domain-containing protein [Cupriavidus basilensis]|uniref:FCD domain-containing protein n=1 Tax=Cupriavidus basilensis TaxID=68895 RepID=A0ABT6AWC0_9BURK|nr:FCD domain-containing protein [Cupriavidus basilensis]MDF3836905.1 FCD domain-containing protein [Cupriavidus basilensis]
MKPRIKVLRDFSTSPESTETKFEEITLAEKAHRMLRADIISGAIPAGQALRLEYLKDRYQISFSPLREALNRLHSEKLVVSTPSRGFRVAPFSEEEMWDIIEARILIDCEALRRSLARADDEWESKLTTSYQALTEETQREQGCGNEPEKIEDTRLEKRHHDFHRCLISGCGSQWLLDISDLLYAQSERYRQPSLRDRSYWNIERNVSQEHKQLLDAAIARDSIAAAGLLARHYRETGRTIRRVLEQTKTVKSKSD